MSLLKTLTAEQCEALLDELMDRHGTTKTIARSVRNRAMAVVMLETGIRVGEVCKLRIDDLWYAEQPVKNLVVRKEIAKNKKERQIPISQRLADTINRMHPMLWSPDNFETSDFAFYSGAAGKCLTTRSVERIIGKAGKQALNIEVTPHMLRHTFASRMMRKTNARIVQALLGHSSLQSTQIYMHPNIEDLTNAINS